jgi:cyclophilin family peptidyl-prolyl cis-trans isomerase
MKSFTQLFACQITALTLFAATIAPACAQNDPIVILQTTKGRIVIRVFRNMVPYTANNFLDLVSRGYYDGKSFHRVEGWVVQGGCPYGNGQGNYTDPDTGRERFIRLEINRNLNHNSAGVVAMARGQGLDSASCQFYILKKPMSQLNGKYAVFGGVVDGLNNIYRIAPGDRIISAQIAGGQAQRSANQDQGEAATPTPTAASGESKEATGASGF